MKAINVFFQWFFWMFGLAGVALGASIVMAGSWTRGIVASMVCFGTMVPLGNFFKGRRELARIAAVHSDLR